MNKELLVFIHNKWDTAVSSVILSSRKESDVPARYHYHSLYHG